MRVVLISLVQRIRMEYREAMKNRSEERAEKGKKKENKAG